MTLKSIQKPTGQLQILVFLHMKEKAPAKFIKHRIGLNPHTASSALTNLVNLKLVSELTNGDCKLTEKGKQVAEHLDKVEDLISK